MKSWQAQLSHWLYTAEPSQASTDSLVEKLANPASSIPGLTVYRRNLYAGLGEHLKGVFSQTVRCAIDTEDSLQNKIINFIERKPPTNPILFKWGGEFPQEWDALPMRHLAEWEWIWHCCEHLSPEDVDDLLLEWQWTDPKGSGDFYASRAQPAGVFHAWQGGSLEGASEKWEQILIVRKEGRLQAFVMEEDVGG